MPPLLVCQPLTDLVEALPLPGANQEANVHTPPRNDVDPSPTSLPLTQSPQTKLGQSQVDLLTMEEPPQRRQAYSRFLPLESAWQHSIIHKIVGGDADDQRV